MLTAENARKISDKNKYKVHLQHKRVLESILDIISKAAKEGYSSVDIRIDTDNRNSFYKAYGCLIEEPLNYKAVIKRDVITVRW